MTSQTLVKLYIDRIKEVQPYLNCVVKDCFSEAIQVREAATKATFRCILYNFFLLKEADKVDEMLVSASPESIKEFEEKKPLLGVPFSCKESIWCEGQPNTTGIIARKDFVAPVDADVVRWTRKAGAILICLTNTSEGCMWFESSNYLYGTTRNPYNLSRIVGGSSGGEGCIVASAASCFGIGSDIGGSIRMVNYKFY